MTTTAVNSLLGMTVREYQDRIARSALSANTLVVLPTGLGKTMIALIVAQGRLGLAPEGKVLILAPTRPLVLQHSEFFRKHMPERPAAVVLTGEVLPQERTELFSSARLIF